MGGNGNGFFSDLIVKLLAAFTIICVVLLGIGLGLSLAETANVKNHENFIELAPALPSKIMDINGTLITEFASDEKRELVPLSELPRHLVQAVLAREDPDFYNHRGFSIRAIARAVVGQLTGKNLGGGSTITQQVSGTLYTDRRERSYKRKAKELWWAFQVERRYTKNEILEIYLNYMPMGPGTYGVETSSKHFFGHSAREATIAESAILAILLSSPARFNPLSNPNDAMDRQRVVIDRMVEFGFVTREEAEESFADYWNNFDYTQASVSAYFNREDKAPWFSEYVRRELDSMMYGSMDYYRDGYVVYTTMDLHHQESAQKFVTEGLERANRVYSSSGARNYSQAEHTYIPIIDLLSIVFDLSDVRAATSGQNERKALSRYTKTLNPIIDVAALTFGISELKDITGQGFAQMKATAERNVVEGALISIENETGYITAIVGGSKYDESNQLIRATQANVQYGSSFKPLYYSAAIDTRKFTAGSLIYDVPVVFHNEDGTPYIPLNFRGEWVGTTLLYNALAQSMNVPSMKVLDGIGFDAAIDRASALLDFTDQNQIRRLFPRVYPLGLGITASSPLRLARAYSVFGNQGRSVTPIAIRSVEDRNGRVVFDVERELRQKQRRMGESIQVISPQNAYIMTMMLEKTVEQGSLAGAAGYGTKFTFKDENGNSFKMPVAGKTGTPQNWSDAWAVGYSPYYTTAVWYGFDKPGNSLGIELTGATLAGPVWGNYMREIHQGLPRRDFIRPGSGIIDVTVCAKSGLLRTGSCNQGAVTLPYLEGTQPAQYCDLHGSRAPGRPETTIITPVTLGGFDAAEVIDSLKMPSLPLDLFPELMNPPPANQQNVNQQTQGTQTQPAQQPPAQQQQTQPAQQQGRNQTRRTTTTNRNTRNTPAQQPAQQQTPPPASNPFLDNDPPASPPPPPNSNQQNNPIGTRREQDIFPDSVVPFVPEPGSNPGNNPNADNTGLPSWNPLE